jgi:hypothetical protein
MSQSSFVLEKDLQFIDVGFLAKVGDVFVFTPPQTMVVYRNGDIQIRMAMTQAAIDGLLINGSFKRIPAAPAPAAVVVTEEAPVVVTETAPVVTEKAPEAPEEAPVVTTEETPTTPEAPAGESAQDEAPAKESAPKAARKSKK